MKLLRYAAVMSLVACSQNIYAQTNDTPETKETKELKTDQNFHDFGEITEGDCPLHTFDFENTTKNTVKILNVRVPCGCAKTKVEKDTLKPDEKTKFEVEFNSKGRLGDSENHFYLITDSNELPIVKYTVKAKIKLKPEPVCYAPFKVDAVTLNPKEIKILTFNIENKGTLDLKIENGTADPMLAVDSPLPITIPASQKQEIKIKITAPAYEGKIRSKIAFKTNDPKKPELPLIVEGEVKKDAVKIETSSDTQK